MSQSAIIANVTKQGEEIKKYTKAFEEVEEALDTGFRARNQFLINKIDAELLRRDISGEEITSLNSMRKGLVEAVKSTRRENTDQIPLNLTINLDAERLKKVIEYSPSGSKELGQFDFNEESS